MLTFVHLFIYNNFSHDGSSIKPLDFEKNGKY